MQLQVKHKSILLLLYSISIWSLSFAHEILFCGERIPVTDEFVSEKLMEVIRNQIPNVNIPELRRRVKMYFPTIEYYLRETGLPDDLKYIPIVESCFQSETSKAGAKGYWQLMPETASEKGLVITGDYDERDNFRKSTYAACKVLAEYYLQIKKTYDISSWVLTTAAYNIGIGKIMSAINNQGKNYFSMELNAETSLYIYKVIAIKELFEYPEYYMEDFGYNIFNNQHRVNASKTVNGSIDSSLFSSMQVSVVQNDGIHPDNLNIKEPPKPTNADLATTEQENTGNSKFKYLLATINEKYKGFNDGDLITVKLGEDLEVKGIFNKKGNLLKGNGWIIDDRIFIDLGHEITLLDITGRKGISLTNLKKNEAILLKVQVDTKEKNSMSL
ncbi:MAG TPA: lytic transglycosylase domain-containing protein [Parafilimonas sp.]|nr:lytic transglycosylase domain-containing protein [Parafilimonas sp.]